MRTTIKLEAGKSLVIQPTPEGVRAAIQLGGYTVGSFVLSPDQVGAVMFALEQAAEAHATSLARAS